MYQSDYLLRQIEMMARFIAKLLFGKETEQYAIVEGVTDRGADLLYLRLRELIDRGEINEAEDILFDHLDGVNIHYMEVAIAFYGLLNSLSERELNDGGFSRAEVDQGLRDAAGLYSIDLF